MRVVCLLVLQLAAPPLTAQSLDPTTPDKSLVRDATYAAIRRFIHPSYRAPPPLIKLRRCPTKWPASIVRFQPKAPPTGQHTGSVPAAAAIATATTGNFLAFLAAMKLRDYYRVSPEIAVVGGVPEEIELRLMDTMNAWGDGGHEVDAVGLQLDDGQSPRAAFHYASEGAFAENPGVLLDEAAETAAQIADTLPAVDASETQRIMSAVASGAEALGAEMEPILEGAE